MNVNTTIAPNWAPVTIASITDGTSNTGLVSEHLIGTTNCNILRNDPQYKRGEWHSPLPAPFGSNQAIVARYVAACNTIKPTVQNRYSCIAGELWTASYPVYQVTNSYTHFGPPNQIACTNSSESWGSYTDSNLYYVGPMGSAHPTSNHPGGVNVEFGRRLT